MRSPVPAPSAARAAMMRPNGADPVRGSDAPPVGDAVAAGDALSDSPRPPRAVVPVCAPLTDAPVVDVVDVAPPTPLMVVVVICARVVVVALPHVTDKVLCACCGPWNVHVTSTSTFAVAPNSPLVAEEMSSCASVVVLSTDTSLLKVPCPSTVAAICTVTPALGNPVKCTVTVSQVALMSLISCADAAL